MGSCAGKPNTESSSEPRPGGAANGANQTEEVRPPSNTTKNNQVVPDTVIAARARRRSSGDQIGLAPDPEAVLRLNKARLKQTRTVRVFISSTFRDFALERDFLMRHALPDIRKYGESRGVTVVFVDLRWGVTSEESSGGQVVKLCLQEIDACRPFFVGMLGERYGWHLDPSRHDALLETTMDVGEKIYPWVQDYRDRSVTELEVIHGALLRPELAHFVTFYFRQHEEFKKNMGSQISLEDLPAYEAESDYARRGQNSLKQKVKDVFPNNISEYNDVKGLCENLVRDLKRAIDHEFPLSGSFDQFDALNLQHEAFAASRRMGYVPQTEIFSALDTAATDGESIAVTGFSGLGKSATLANWISHIAARDPRAAVFSHYIGCTTESTNFHHILRRIFVFFAKKLQLDIKDFSEEAAKKLSPTPEELPPNEIICADVLSLTEDKLVELIPEFLAQAVAVGKEQGVYVVILLDGLDQLEDRGNAHTLFWLPDVPGVRYICSIKQIHTVAVPVLEKDPTEALLADVNATPRISDDSDLLSQSKSDPNILADTASKYWGQRSWKTIPMTELQRDEQKSAIVGYLREHAKKLDEKQIEMVLAATPASNPLYLRTLLDEARLFGNFFALTEHLATLLTTTTNKELYGLVLRRMGTECGCEMMRWAVGSILCARDGITDQELRAVLLLEVENTTEIGNLTQFKIQGDADIRSFVQLLFALREQLCSTSGFLRFFHDAVKEAVREELGIDSPETMQGIKLLHARLAQYFGQEEIEESSDVSAEEVETRKARQLREYPYHLALSGQHLELAAYLSRVDVLESMLGDESKKYELLLYWRQIHNVWTKKHSKDQVEPESKLPICGVEEYLNEIAQRSKKGCDITKYHQLTSVEHKAMQAKILNASKSMDYISTLLVLLGMFDCAVNIRQDEITYSTVLYGATHDKISVSCSELADVYERVYSKYDVSLQLKTRAVEIDRKLYGEENRQLAIGYDNLALLHLKLGSYKDAEEMYQKSLTIKEKVCGPFHRDVAQTSGSLGLLHEELGNISKAHTWYQRSLDIRTKAFGPAHPSVARSEIDMGMLILKEDGTDVRAKSLPLVKQGYDSLISALGRGHSDVAAAANNLGLVYSKLEEYSIALKYHLEAKKTQLRRLGDDHPAYAATSTNIGSACQELAEQAFRQRNGEEEDEYFATAEENYSRAVLIYRIKIGDKHPELATSLQNLGTLYFDSVNRDTSRVKEMIQDVDPAKPCETLNEDIEFSKDKIKESLQTAISNFKEALSIREVVFGKDHPTTLASLDSLEVCSDRLKRFEESNGEDLGEDDAQGEDDLVEICANDLEKLQPYVDDAFKRKLDSGTTHVKYPSVQFNTVVDKVSQLLAVELPTKEDIEKAITTLKYDIGGQFDANQCANVMQTILRQVYL